MKVAIIDADLIGRTKHRFPNLVCEKISGYWKAKKADVELKLDYDDLDDYDEVFISKVFTETWVPGWILDSINMETGEITLPKKIHIGGTGFFFAKAPNLEYDIEHHMPDYHLYDNWIEGEVKRAREKHAFQEEIKYRKSLLEGKIDEEGNLVIYVKKRFNESKYRTQFKEYTDYSIGFVTRGCFRKCPFCVNQKYDHVFLHSPLDEFFDPAMKKICLLDDNFLGCPQWKAILLELIATNKPFKFKQGIDERLLTDEKCELLFSANYDGDFTFAFDNINDYDLIRRKLKMIRKYTRATNIKFYVLVGFESVDERDVINMWRRVELLMRYQCLPYIMRYRNKNETPWENSEYRGLYITMARWCNQPNFFKKKSFREYCEANQALVKTPGYTCSSMKAMEDFEGKYPDIAKQYFDLKFDNHYLLNEEEDRWNI